MTLSNLSLVRGDGKWLLLANDRLKQIIKALSGGLQGNCSPYHRATPSTLSIYGSCANNPLHIYYNH